MQWELFMGRHPKFHSSHENIRFTQLQRVHPMRKKLLVYIWALYCRSMHALNLDNQHILVNTLSKYKCIGDFSLGEPLISNLTAALPTQSQKISSGFVLYFYEPCTAGQCLHWIVMVSPSWQTLWGSTIALGRREKPYNCPPYMPSRCFVQPNMRFRYFLPVSVEPALELQWAVIAEANQFNLSS